MGNYITEAEVRSEGGAGPSVRIENRIVKWEALVERLTGNVFRVLSPGELRFDGNNMIVLHFNLPLIAVSSVKINDETVALAVTEYRAFTGRTSPQDDRYNPKIELTPTGMVSPIFRTYGGRFLKGYGQLITATWGFVDLVTADPVVYAPPGPVKAALLQLVCLDLDGYFERGSNAARDVKREITDGHHIEFAEERKSTWGMLPADVADVLLLYRRPQIISAPDSRVFDDSSIAVTGY